MKNIIFKPISEINEAEVLTSQANLHNLKLFSRYYAGYYQNNFMDHSFLVISDDVNIGLVLVYQIGHQLTYPGAGIQVELFTENRKECTTIYNQIVDHLHSLTQDTGCQEVVIRDNFREGKLAHFGEILLSQRYHATLSLEMKVEFENFNQEDYFKNIRRRYKPFINWGKKNLTIQIINKDNLEAAKFLEFKEFHLKISGRQTRSDQTWNIQQQQLAEGCGELLLGYLDGRMVAGSLFLDQNHVCIYATGVYERDLFEYGLSHYLMFYGICRAFDRGTTKSFSLGQFEQNVKDKKLNNIQFFKRGFCPNLSPILMWNKLSDSENCEEGI